MSGKLWRIVVDTNVFCSLLLKRFAADDPYKWRNNRLIKLLARSQSVKLLLSNSVYNEYQSVLLDPDRCAPQAAAEFFIFLNAIAAEGQVVTVRPERLFVAAVPTEEQKLRKKVRALLRDIDFRSAEERILARETVLHNLRFKDDKFLTCAAAGKADVLLTRDRDFSRLAEHAPQFVAWDGVRMTSAAFEELDFRVLSPEGFYAETD